MMREEGLDEVFRRHEALADRIRDRATRMGFSLHGPGITARSPTLTALRVPDGVDVGELRARLRSEGIQIAGGLRAYKTTCIRIGHMGDIQLEDVDRTSDALERAVTESRV